MKITVRVKPRSKATGVVLLPDGTYQVNVNAPPVEGRANEQVIEELAEHFKRPKRDISILKGVNGRLKIIEIS